jgi:hypothetical protein
VTGRRSTSFCLSYPALDASGKPLPAVVAEKPEAPVRPTGRSKRTNFRIIATNVPANRVPWPKPRTYDAKNYELLARYLDAFVKVKGRSRCSRTRNTHCTDSQREGRRQQQRAFLDRFHRQELRLPRRRLRHARAIWQEHVDYVQGFYYFLAHDPRVPKDLQKEVNEWGLARDEYVDSDHWPHQLYVARARRMVGVYVATQKELQTDLRKPDVIVWKLQLGLAQHPELRELPRHGGKRR